ncbi:MAG: response regulator [Proteobacteria bacterium]|nr:response regulator [Pseudomonadota bacterium]
MTATTQLRRHLVIIEDEDDTRELLVSAVSHLGYDVTSYRHPLEFLPSLAQTTAAAPHAILSDINMPHMNGIEMLTKLRAAGNNTPVIFLTGYGSIETVIGAVRLGACDFLMKPCEMNEIDMVVTRALEIGFRQLQASNIIASLKANHPDAVPALEKLDQLQRNQILMKAMNTLRRVS